MSITLKLWWYEHKLVHFCCKLLSSASPQASISSNESTIIIEIFSGLPWHRQVSMSHPACKKSKRIIILLCTRLSAINFYSSEFMGDWFFCTTCAARIHRCNRRCSTGIDRMLHAMTEVDNVSLSLCCARLLLLFRLPSEKFEQPDEDETARCRWISHGVMWICHTGEFVKIAFYSLIFHRQQSDKFESAFQSKRFAFVWITNWKRHDWTVSILRSDRVLEIEPCGQINDKQTHIGVRKMKKTLTNCQRLKAPNEK